MPSRLTLSAYAGPMPRPGGADLVLAEEALGDLVDRGVVGRDDVGVRGDDQALLDVDAAGGERVDLAEERLRGDDDAVADDARAARVRMPLGSRWVANFSPSMTIVWPALWPPRRAHDVVDVRSRVVASRSVALPLPSSPHWAPRITMAGIAASCQTDSNPGGTARALDVRGYRTRGSSGPRLPHLGGLRSAAWTPAGDHERRRRHGGRGDARAAVSRCCGRARRSRWPRPPTPASSTACCTAPAPGASSSPAATAACTRWWPRCTAATTSKSAVIALLPMGTGNDFARAMDIPLDIEEAARVVLEGEVRPVDLIVDDTGQVVVNNVHVGAGAQASRRGARWKDAARLDRGRQGQPRPDRLPDRRLQSAFCRRRCTCASRSTARSSTTSTSRC